MKRSYISIIVLVLALSVSAQAPLSFKYQAYLRNADGTIRGNEFITLQLRIRQGSANGSAVYTEVHNTSTNSPGRAGRYLPAPPQIRTSSFSASGSSVVRFAVKTYKKA